MARRQCTSEYKLKPLVQKQRELAGLAKGQRSKEHLITSIIGISWDEMQRMKDPLFPWIMNEYPLVERRLTRYDCLRWLSDHGYGRPPRSACCGCPFRSNEEWRALKEYDPADWEDAVRFDHQIRHGHPTGDPTQTLRGVAFLHSSRLPLDQADIRSLEDKGQQVLFENECEGMCGL